MIEVLKTFRLIPCFEKNNQIVTFAQTLLGKVTIMILFFIFNYIITKDILNGILICISIGFIAYSNMYRHRMLMLMTLLFTGYMQLHFLPDLIQVIIPYLVLIFFVFSLSLIRKFNLQGLLKRPVITLFSMLLIFVCIGKNSSIITIQVAHYYWSFILFFITYIWFFAYAFVAERNKQINSNFIHLGVVKSFWNVTVYTPIAKGLAYLARFEARNPKDLAITQIKGLKLLIWVIVLKCVFVVWIFTVRKFLIIPTYGQAFELLLRKTPLSIGQSWLSLASDFLENLIDLSLFFGPGIAYLRLSGFKILRNTCRPLNSNSIADFWNRYFYYFKELLVDFFFFPTYARYFKNHPKMRLFFATFMSAGFGNWFFHFARSAPELKDNSFINILKGYQTYGVYCLILSVGIGISQIVEYPQTTKFGWLRNHVLPLFSILIFFCILHVFNKDRGLDYVLYDRFDFFVRLFGLHLT